MDCTVYCGCGNVLEFELELGDGYNNGYCKKCHTEFRMLIFETNYLKQCIEED